LGFRGTEVALVDYAWGNREILGHESVFVLPRSEKAESHPVVQKMFDIAPVRFYSNAEEREAILREEKVDFFYAIKNGWNDGVVSLRVRTGIHAIFRESEFHGDVYAYVSPWLSQVMSRGRSPWVPHMVRLAESDEDLRKELNIPAEALVFGRHGGEDSFDIPWVKEAVAQAARKNPQAHFIFLNTRRFIRGELPNLHHLPPTVEGKKKRSFLNAADVMIHGRERGETFGLACLEFAWLGKPILSYQNSPEKGHLQVLGKACQTYRDQRELNALLMGRKSDFSCREDLSAYHPSNVMKHFSEVFLQKG